MITPEQVADVQPGDVVRIRNINWPEGTSVTGPAYRNPDTTLTQLFVGGHPVKTMAVCGTLAEFEVVSRAPRPLYVNSDRTEAVEHDVIRDGEGVIRHCDAVGFAGKPTWWGIGVVEGCRWTHTTIPPQPLTLLVDGTTGQAVTS